MPPRRNTRPADNPQPPPRPGFQTVLNSLLAQRDAALGVTIPSQPIARWESSSQPEILWELLAERRRAGVPPSLSQEQNAAVEAAIAHIPPAIIDDTIVEMEVAVSTSQGASPALTVVSDAFWNALQAVLPASGIPDIVTKGPAFQEAHRSNDSAGSSPMDTSSDGILAPQPHSPSLITPFPALGDLPNAPIVLSSDSDHPAGEHEVAPATHVEVTSPPDGGGVASSPPDHVTPSEALASDGMPANSDDTPLDSVSSWGRDAGHPLELSSDPSTHSSLRSSEIPDVPDMGPARRGGRMTTGKVTDDLEGANPAVLARLRYSNIVPARDTRSSAEPAIKRGVTNEILRQFAVTDLSDGSVFTYANLDTAHEEAEASLHGATDELNQVRLGFSHYFLRDPINLVEDPSVPIESNYLRRMADIVGAVLCGGPCATSESDEDVYGSLLPGDWFRLATFLMAAIARGCLRTSDLCKKGSFDVNPCKDDFILDPSITAPVSQAALLQAIAAQITEELHPVGALMPQDSADGLRATIWRAHEGQIRAWTEREVLSVYSRLSDICLSDIVDKIQSEAPVEQITDAIREEIGEETRGKFLGLIAQEKTRAYEAAITEARAEALKEAMETGRLEAAQKGRSYEKIQLDRAEEEARLEAARLFKKRLASERDKMAHKVDVEIRKERDQVLAERRSALEAGLASMDWDARVDHIRSLAVQAGLLDESDLARATPPKRAEPPQATTAPTATSGKFKQPSDAESRAAIAKFVDSSASGPSPEQSHSDPSPCPAAGEDDPPSEIKVHSMDWADDSSEELPPLPIDFDSKERSSGASIHCPANAMIDDSSDVVALASFRDPDSGALPLTPSPQPTPAPAPVSEAAQLFDRIMDAIRPMQAELKRIGDKVDGKPTPSAAPPPKGKSPSTSQSSRGPTVRSATEPIRSPPPFPPTNSPPTILDDVAEERSDEIRSSDPNFPPLAPSGSRKTRYRRKVADELAVRNASVPGAPAPGRGRQNPGFVRAPPVFASVITKSAMGAQQRAADGAKTARDIQRRGPSGKLKPGHSAAPLGFTEVVVTRNGGLDDVEEENAFRRKIPVDIVQAAQRALNKASRDPPLILRGRWTENVAKTGNFVYRLAGDIPIATILACRDQLCEPFPPGDVWIVPTKGWTWVQLRGVDVTYAEDDVDYVFEGDQLLQAFSANPCFQGVDIMVPPHFQGNPANFKQKVATVIAAISDPDNSRCQRAAAEGVCMFGRQVKFVRAGDSPSLVQCSRCHQVGHYFSSPKCRLPPGENKCFRCGGPHHSDNHDFECRGTHATQGVCNCPKKCILCKGSGHTARDKACPRRGDFAPPRLLRPTPVEESQGVDSRMVAPPAVSRAKARTLPLGKGKETTKAGTAAMGVSLALQDARSSFPEGICAETGVYDLLCFCCPMPDTETYRKRYVQEEGPDSLRTSKGSSIIDLHTEFSARKASNEKLIRIAQTNYGDKFHQDEELAAIIAQCEHRKSDTLDYGPRQDPSDDWIRNMPLDEQVGEAVGGPSAVEVADAGISDWKSITADARRAPPGAPPGAVLHTITNPGGRPTNLGWAVPNRFEVLKGPQADASPSEVADHA
jgi:hypothetical protein